MLYQVSRNGQMYGPYTLEDLQRYVASGNVLPTDMAKSEEMMEWLPVAQILGQIPGYVAAEAPAVPMGVAAPYAGGGTPAYPAAMPYPDPPNLHWALVLVIGIFTCGLFFIVWDFVQSVWMRKVNPRSNALFFYIAELVVNFGGSITRMALIASSGFALHRNYYGIGIPTSVITIILLELARFDMHRAMEEHFNGPEPVGLSLNGAMTFFFGSLYFQYHFSRINEMKRIARYRGAAI